MSILYGTTGANTLNGSSAVDAIFGAEGNDVIHGGGGHDNRDNFIFFDPAEYPDGPFYDGLTVVWIGSQQYARGGLYGGAGNDSIVAGGGNDYLAGGTGTDVLAGGGGGDYFAFRWNEDGQDRIIDFKRPAGDKIDLRDVNTVAELDFVKNFDGDGNQVKFSNGKVRIDLDGDQTADIKITVDDMTSMKAADFIL